MSLISILYAPALEHIAPPMHAGIPDANSKLPKLLSAHNIHNLING